MHDLLVETLYRDETYRVWKAEHDSPLWCSGVELRSSSGRNTDVLDIYDRSAQLYVLESSGICVASMRVNRGRDGLMDCEEYFPDIAHGALRPMIGSASRFVKRDPKKAELSLMREFIDVIRRRELGLGIKVDLINVHDRMANYYLRVGYLSIPNTSFTHPRFGTPSHIMFRVLDPTWDHLHEFHCEVHLENSHAY